MSLFDGKYVVAYSRYGAQLYYVALSYEDAIRFARIYTQVGEISVLSMTGPDGTRLDIPTEEYWVPTLTGRNGA